jgi:hypothetical protein
MSSVPEALEVAVGFVTTHSILSDRLVKSLGGMAKADLQNGGLELRGSSSRP